MEGFYLIFWLRNYPHATGTRPSACQARSGADAGAGLVRALRRPREFRAPGRRRHAQPLLPRVVPVLATLTGVRCRRGLGADGAPCRPVRGTRGEAGVAAGAPALGAGSSASPPLTGAASASETP